MFFIYGKDATDPADSVETTVGEESSRKKRKRREAAKVSFGESSFDQKLLSRKVRQTGDASSGDFSTPNYADFEVDGECDAKKEQYGWNDDDCQIGVIICS